MGELEIRKPEQRLYRITIERHYQTGLTPQPIAASVECWAWDYYDALKTVLGYLAANPPEPGRADPPRLHRIARRIKGRTDNAVRAEILSLALQRAFLTRANGPE